MASLAVRVVSVPVVAAVLVAGVWVAGGVLTNDFRASMALTGLWFVLAGVACVVTAVRRPALRLPVLAAYLVTAGVVGGYLALTTLRDRVVHERVVVAATADAELARGAFRSHEHATTGSAAVVRLADGRRFLTLTAFETAAGPDLRVRLVRGDGFDGGAEGAIDLGALKGNRGDQQYRVPPGAEVAGRTVVIWCRAFSAPFGSARLS